MINNTPKQARTPVHSYTKIRILFYSFSTEETQKCYTIKYECVCSVDFNPQRGTLNSEGNGNWSHLLHAEARKEFS